MGCSSGKSYRDMQQKLLEDVQQKLLEARYLQMEQENRKLLSMLKGFMDVVIGPYFSAFIGTLDPLALKILSFWFGARYDGESVDPEQYHLWFGKSAETDLEIITIFGDHLDDAAKGLFDAWTKHPYGSLALVILMDQFPRNIFRNTARSFAYDWKACLVTWDAIAAHHDTHLSVIERVWFYLVFTHAEDVEMQKRCVSLARNKLDGMDENFKNMWTLIFEKHLVVIEKFGRFPHRNPFLKRISTEAEEKWVNDPKFRFDLPVKLTIDPLTGAAGFNFIMADAQPDESIESAIARKSSPEDREHYDAEMGGGGLNIDPEVAKQLYKQRAATWASVISRSTRQRATTDCSWTSTGYETTSAYTEGPDSQKSGLEAMSKGEERRVSIKRKTLAAIVEQGTTSEVSGEDPWSSTERCCASRGTPLPILREAQPAVAEEMQKEDYNLVLDL